MDNQLQAIRVFTRVVETGGFSKAADSLGMPKATVTKLVQNLENHLQTKLLQRTTRKVNVTLEGHCYYQQVSPWLLSLSQIEGSITDAGSIAQGVLRIDTSGSTARQLLLPRLASFTRNYPLIQIDLGINDRPIDIVADGVDCVIRSGPLQDSSLIARRLCDIQWVTCASPAYLAQYGKPQHPDELEQGYPIGHYRNAVTDRLNPLVFVDQDKRWEIHSRYSVSVNESNAHLAVALGGLGIIQTIDFMADPYIKQGRLEPLLSQWRPPGQQLYLLYPSNRHLTTKLRVFIDWALATLSNPLDNDNKVG